MLFEADIPDALASGTWVARCSVPDAAWPKGYLDCDGVGAMGSEVRRRAPTVLAGINHHAAAAAAAATSSAPSASVCTVFRVPGGAAAANRVRDRLLVAIDSLIASVEPAVDPARFTARFQDDVCVLACAPAAPVAPAIPAAKRARVEPVLHSLSHVAWVWEGSGATPRPKVLGEARSEAMRRRRLAECAAGAGVVDAHLTTALRKRRPEAGKTFTLRVEAYKVAEAGWLDGLPATFLLCAADSPRRVGKLVFEHPSSKLRRLLRRLAKSGAKVPTVEGGGAEVETEAEAETRTEADPTNTQLHVVRGEVFVEVAAERMGVAHVEGGSAAAAAAAAAAATAAAEAGEGDAPAAAAPVEDTSTIELYRCDLRGLDSPKERWATQVSLREAYASAVAETPTADAAAAGGERKKEEEDEREAGEGDVAAAASALVAALSSHAQPGRDGRAWVAPGASVLPCEVKVVDSHPTMRMTVSEGKRVEFKRYQPRLKTMAQVVRGVVCTFVNSGGGRLYVGVNDQGTVEGIKDCTPALKREMEDAVRSVVSGLRPRVPDNVVSVTFHTTSADTPAAPAGGKKKMVADWWKGGGGGSGGGGGAATAAAPASSAAAVPSSRVVMEVAVGECRRWPFHLCHPWSAVARVRLLASSGVLSEDALAVRAQEWLSSSERSSAEALGRCRRRKLNAKQKRKKKLSEAASAAAEAEADATEATAEQAQ